MRVKKDYMKIIYLIFIITVISTLIVFSGCSGETNTDNVVDAQNQGEVQEQENLEESGNDNTGGNNTEETVGTEPEDNNISDNETADEEKENSGQNNDTSKEENKGDLKSIYQKFMESGKPSIIVFSYDADCCPGTKAFFEAYNEKAMNLMNNYAGKFNNLFINMGILDKTNMNTAIEIAAANEILNLPSILILDATGAAFKVIDGDFTEDAIVKILEEVLND